MTNITSKEIIDLMFLPVTDTKVVETLDALGMEQPSLDEKYEMEGRICAEGEETSGITICFEAPDRNSANGEPIVEQIDFYEEIKVTFPLGIHKSDDYETVIEKIGRKPDFCDNVLDTFKQWVFPYKDTEITYCVQFKKGFKGIDTIVVGEFDREGIDEDPFIFPCNELE